VETCVLDQIELEAAAALPELPAKFSRGSNRPKEVLNAWFRKENQGGIGSCNGAAWAALGERVNYSSRGDKTTQLSKLWMYLAAQSQGGLLGADNGSRPTDGGKVALKWICPESVVPYTAEALRGVYPGRSERARILAPENAKAGEPFAVKQVWRKPQSHAETLDLIGVSGGGWVFGIVWYQGLIPPDRIVRSFNPRGKRVLGAHAMCVLGYHANENLESHNSHNDGPYQIEPQAWEQMLAHSQTSCVGATGTIDAKPVDWLKDSPWN
jgi:hypothetical protein